MIEKHRLKPLIENLINELRVMIEKVQGRSRLHAQTFFDDLEFYYGYIDNNQFPHQLHEGWADIIVRRLNYYFDPVVVDGQTSIPFGGDFISHIEKSGRRFVNTLQGSGTTTTPTFNLYFSQTSCSSHFADHQTVAKGGFPFTGMDIPEVAAKIRADFDLSLNFAIRVTWYKGAWVALNNRGMACLFLAGTLPLRIRPDLMTQEEKNRFASSANITFYRDKNKGSIPADEIHLENTNITVRRLPGLPDHDAQGQAKEHLKLPEVC